jgi:hypothetical protein
MLNFIGILEAKKWEINKFFMSKYLTIEQAKSRLSLGKSIEQWLNVSPEEQYTIIKWIKIDKEKDGTFSVAFFESFDEGSDNYVDIYNLSLVEPDEPYGRIDNFDSIGDALKFAESNYAAKSEKYVTAGMIQEEYIKYQKDSK